MKTKLLTSFLGLVLGINVSFAQNTVTYTETQDIIANPERGLQKYSITDNNYNTSSGYSNISTSEITGWRTGTDKVTVIFRYFLLDAYLNNDISATYLANMQIDFNRIRSTGLKCIIRFSYSNEQHASNAQQPTKAQILTHLTQLAPILEANKDIILSHQAGFIGTWGEWYYTNSSEFGTDGNINTTQWQNRKAVVDAMLNATPVSIPIQVRYPAAKKAMYGTSTLNSSTAYQNTANARIGFFNDAFLNEWGDMGTYEVSSGNENPVGTADYTYLSNETQYTPMSGETNGLNAPRTDGANAVSELNLTNWSMLNRDYYTPCFTNWINSGHYNDILRGLGYRYVLRSSIFNFNNTTLSLTLQLENVGYARMFKARTVFIVLKNTSTGSVYTYPLVTDPRTWSSTMNISETIDLTDLPAGTYDTYLHLPDADATLATRSEYSVRFANSNVWDATTGFNNLSQQITKSVTTSVINGSTQEILIYPNPALSNVTIDTKEQPADIIYIYNSNGQAVRTINPQSSINNIDLSALPAGIYVVQVVTNKQVTSYPLSIK